MYVRKGKHFFDGDIHDTFDVANIEVTPSKRGKGYFKAFLVELNALLLNYPQFKYIYVQSVLEPRLTEYLPSVGFTLVEGSIPPSFYRAIK